MTIRPPLAVVLHGHHVADVLDVGDGDPAVRYTAHAVRNPAESRLSLSLPVRAHLYPSTGPGGRWVRSLLPEGKALGWAIQHFGIPHDDRYGLIEALGADVAGAVRVLRDPDQVGDDGSYEVLSEEQLAEIANRSPEVGLALDDKRGVRLSLPGVQDKFLLHRVDGRYALPIHGAPSTLIVKPEPGVLSDGTDVAGLATNELFCLVLARSVGLDAADAHVETFGDKQSLVVHRFDRTAEGTRVVRHHQEDLLGAQGLDPLLKYERPHVERLAPTGFALGNEVTSRPGPTLRDLARCLETFTGRARLTTFLEAVTFNVVIGNADSHARNYSVLLHRDGTVGLAPLYDLISTCCYEGLDREFAQRVNGSYELDVITTNDLILEGISWGIPERVATSRVRGIIERIAERTGLAAEDAARKGADSEALMHVTGVVTDRARTFLVGAS